MSWNDANLKVCQEAFYILRQDIPVPTAAEAESDTSLEWQKCKLAYETAREEVLAAHDWVFARTPANRENIAEWPGDVRSALVYCLARELAIPIAGRHADMQSADALYRDKLQKARIRDLEDETVSDPLASEVLSAIRGYYADDSKLPRSIATFVARLNAVKAAALDEAKSAHAWTGVTQATDYAGLPPLVKAAYVALVECRIALALGLPPDALKLFEERYQLKLVAAKKADLDALLATNADPVLAELLDNFRADDAALTNVYAVYAQRVAAVKATAAAEIADAHAWATPFAATATTHRAYPAFVALCVSRLAIACGCGADCAQLAEQKYVRRLQSARIAELETSAAPSDLVTREVLASIRAPFSVEDARLPRTMQTFLDRVSDVKEASFNEILAEQKWRWADVGWDDQTSLDAKIAAMDGLSRAAFVALVTQKLAIPCGLPAETLQFFERQYQQKLRSARVADLEQGIDDVTDPVDKEVLSLIRGGFASDADLPHGIDSLLSKIGALKTMARQEVLSAHDWSFAEADVVCDGPPTRVPDPLYPFHVAIPFDCIKVASVYHRDGTLAQWKVRGREIHAAKPVARVVYVRDVTDFDEWQPLCYRAYILRLAADTAKAVAAPPKERQYQEQLYRDALETARAADASAQNAPDDAWGDVAFNRDPLAR